MTNGAPSEPVSFTTGNELAVRAKGELLAKTQSMIKIAAIDIMLVIKEILLLPLAIPSLIVGMNTHYDRYDQTKPYERWIAARKSAAKWTLFLPITLTRFWYKSIKERAKTTKEKNGNR